MKELSKDILKQNIVVRGHADIYEMIQRRKNGEEYPIVESWFPRLSRAKVDIVFLAVSGDSLAHRDGDMRYLHAAQKILDYVLLESEENSKIKIIKTPKDIPDKPDGNLYFLLTLEGGLPLEGSLHLLRQFYRLGIRLLQPTHNLRNELADGSYEKHTGSGLSRFGVKVIEEANKLGMIVDLSHLSESGFWHALEVSKKPVIVSHADCKSVKYHDRNLSDEQIKAISKQGGTIGVLYFPNYLKEGYPTMEVCIEHIKYLLELVGPESISIGHLGLDKPLVNTFSDIKSGPYKNYHYTTQKFMGGVDEKEQYEKLVCGLLELGLKQDDIKNIIGGNLIRTIRNVL